MRYSCPTCSRVFYLDANMRSPCPACGTMLKPGDEAQGLRREILERLQGLRDEAQDAAAVARVYDCKEMYEGR